MCKGLRRARRLSPPSSLLAVDLVLVMNACASNWRLGKPLYAYECVEISIVSGAAQAGEVCHAAGFERRFHAFIRGVLSPTHHQFALKNDRSAAAAREYSITAIRYGA